MKIQQLNDLILHLGKASGLKVDATQLRELFTRPMEQDPENDAILRKLSMIGQHLGLNMSNREITLREYRVLLGSDFPPHILWVPGQAPYPVVISSKSRRNLEMFAFVGEEGVTQNFSSIEALFSGLQLDVLNTGQKLEYTVGYLIEDIGEEQNFRPRHVLSRFFKLLNSERKDIYYILTYALLAGGLSLALPIGVQTIINFVMSGAIADTMILLIVAVVFGTLMTGGLQVLQLILVETLQQRFFAKKAFEFAFRIPRIQVEAFGKYYPPELMNRFFDVVTVQKGFAKLLTDFAAALLQVVFGLLLLSFYHPFFILFNLILLFVIYLIFRMLGPYGMKSSMEESDYKYKAANWIEEMARSLTTFKTAGHSTIALEKMDTYTLGYLKARKRHFEVLKFQYGSMVIFKTLVTGALLILGSLLVVSRDLSIGQFVAAEIVVILIINATEKIILFLEVIYDTLTGLEKLGKITDLPLEKSGVLMTREDPTGISVELTDLNFKYGAKGRKILSGVNLELKSGERMILTGSAEAGKNTLLMALGGSLTTFEGHMSFNGISFRDLNLNDLRQHIGFFNRQNEIFEGTLEENLVLNQPKVTFGDMRDICSLVGLDDYLKHLEDGFGTYLPAAGRTLSISIQRRIIIARALLGKPMLVLMDEDYAEFVTRTDFRRRFDFFDRSHPWSVIAISSDPELMKRCDQVAWLADGKIKTLNTFENLVNDPEFVQTCIVR